MTTREARHQIHTLTLAFWSPSESIDRAAGHTSPAAMQAVLIALQVATAALAYPIALEAAVRSLPPGILEETYLSMVSNMRLVGYLSLAVAVVGCFVWWYGAAGVLHILNILLAPREQSFRCLLTLSVLTSVYLTAGEACKVLILYLRGRETLASTEGLQVAIGLNLLPVDWSPFWYSFLNHVNPFELSSALFTAYGFTRLTKSAPAVSYLSIFTLWLCLSALRSL